MTIFYKIANAHVVIGFFIVVIVSCSTMTMHNQNKIADAKQWKKVQSILLLSADEIVEIQNKIGNIASQKLNCFVKAIDRLSAKQVTASKPFSSDALRAAPQYHERIIENQYLRILWATLNVGEKSNFHTHQWPNVLLMVSLPITGIIHKKDGTSINEEWDLDIEESQGEAEPLAFTNCGPHNFEGLVVELKQALPISDPA